MKLPIAMRISYLRKYHDDNYIDFYDWLRNKNNSKIRKYLYDENQYTNISTSNLKLLEVNIFKEIKARNKETDLSVPIYQNGWWYYSRSQEGKQYPLHCRCPVNSLTRYQISNSEKYIDKNFEQILLDENSESEGHDYFSLGVASISLDNNILAFSVDFTGNERYTLRFKNLYTGKLYKDTVENISAGGTWSADNQTFYYTSLDESWRPDTVWRYQLNSGKTSEKLYQEFDESFWVSVERTRSDKYIFINSRSAKTTETQYIDTLNSGSNIVKVWNRCDSVEYVVEHITVGNENKFLIMHNKDAENFTLVESSINIPTNFRILIEQQKDIRLENLEAFKDFLAISYRKQAVSNIMLWSLTKSGYGKLKELAFNLNLTSVEISENPNWYTSKLKINMSSFLTPTKVYNIDLITYELTLLRKQTVLGFYKKENYLEYRNWAITQDGTYVPISIFHRSDLKFPAPTVLYGYGAYEICENPKFSISRLSLLDRGMIFAVAHIRGGGEMGRKWYDQGRLMNKKATFTDFIAVARHLINTKITNAQSLVALGGSAGGLLMGVIANISPRIFSGVLAQVPFVDSLNTILNPKLPLTITEWDEWGNPLENPEFYYYIKSYTPYENISKQDYPTILAMTSLNDTRVQYVEPAKWVSSLKYNKTNRRLVLLKTTMTAGHCGLSGRYDYWNEISFQNSWLIGASKCNDFNINNY